MLREYCAFYLETANYVLQCVIRGMLVEEILVGIPPLSANLSWAFGGPVYAPAKPNLGRCALSGRAIRAIMSCSFMNHTFQLLYLMS
jgi:hypothetical protein